MSAISDPCRIGAVLRGDDFSNEGGRVHVPDRNHLLWKRSLAAFSALSADRLLDDATAFCTEMIELAT